MEILPLGVKMLRYNDMEIPKMWQKSKVMLTIVIVRALRSKMTICDGFEARCFGSMKLRS